MSHEALKIKDLISILENADPELVLVATYKDMTTALFGSHESRYCESQGQYIRTQQEYDELHQELKNYGIELEPYESMEKVFILKGNG